MVTALLLIYVLQKKKKQQQQQETFGKRGKRLVKTKFLNIHTP